MVDVVDLAVVVRGHVPAIRQRVSVAVAAAQEDPQPRASGRRRWGQRGLLVLQMVEVEAVPVAGARVDAGAAVRQIRTVGTARRTDLIELLWHRVWVFLCVCRIPGCPPSEQYQHRPALNLMFFLIYLLITETGCSECTCSPARRVSQRNIICINHKTNKIDSKAHCGC